jgi:eukaryotic-like serine/threonine-protein kinase
METIEKLGKYEVKRTLGRGAMGVVYEGWDPTIQRIVAIKTVPVTDTDDPETQESIARFRREAQAAGRLTHPNIVSVFDYGETADVAYIVMEFVNGPSLRDVMGKDQRFTLPDIVKIMHDVLAGLEHSHEQGVVHRDIKPANLMLTSRERDRARIKISDFGIARLESSSMTQAGVMMGTPTYMSPEQFMGQPVDARSDIYSCGVMLYQLLTGERPFEGGLSAIMHKVLHTEPIAPSHLSVSVTPALDAVVQRAMAKRPDDRYQNAQAFAAALDAAVRAPGPRAAAAAGLDEATMVAHPLQPPAGEMDATMAMPSMATTPPMAMATTPPVAMATTPPVAMATMPPVAASGAPAPPPDATVFVAPPAPKRGAMPLIAGALAALVAVAGGGAYFVLRPAELPKPAPPERVVSQGAVSQGAVSQGAASQGVGPQATTNPAPASPAPSATPRADTSPPPAIAQQTPPAPPPTAAVTPTPAPPSPAVPAPAPDIAGIRERFAQIAAGEGCSLLNGSVSEKGTVTLTGLAGPGVRDDIRDALAGALVPVLWHTTPIDTVFCFPLDILRPIATPFAAADPRLGLSLADDRLALHDGQRIRPRVVMPGFAGYLRVDYVTRDGAVQHLYPQIAGGGVVADKVRMLAAGERLALGDPPAGQPAWEAGPPYGVDLIIAVASAQPLFSAPRPANVEKAEGYLHDLAAAIRAFDRSGGRVTGNAMPVETLPK